jgi:hypothetical protein
VGVDCEEGLNVDGLRRCKEIIDFLMFEMGFQESVQ